MAKIELPYDKETEIDAKQFNRLSREFKGMFAWKKSDTKGKFIVKQWSSKFRKQMEDCIN